MEAKQRCFNCRYVSYRPEDFAIHSNQRQPLDEYISYNGLKALFGGQRPAVCADCVYDRLQNCQRCSRKAPLSLYNVEEWFKNSNDRICQDCVAIQATQIAFRNGLMLKDTLNQCFECSVFKTIHSFLSFCHLKQFDAICRECHVHKDIARYRVDLKARYHQNWSQAPALTEVQVDLEAIPVAHQPLLSYAKVLREGQTSVKDTMENEQTGVGTLSLDRQPGEPPTFFQTTMDVNICANVLHAFKQSLCELEGKTKLELQILHQDPKVWQVVLRSKLVQVSQKFSSQATNKTSFREAEIRSAYLGTYCCSHASLVRAAVTSGCFPPFVKFVKESREAKSPLHVCCIGAGPGSEVLGLHEFLPKDTHWHLMDNCEQWSLTAQSLLKSLPDLQFNYGLYDITQQLHNSDDPMSPVHIFQKATLFVFVKFVSAVHFLKKSKMWFREMLQFAPLGSIFLFVDNAHHRVTRFIENFVFPDGVYEEHKSCRENDYYKLYTCYAELHPTAESMRSAQVTELVGLVKYWLHRSPLLDFHVNIFLLVKKRNMPGKENAEGTVVG